LTMRYDGYSRHGYTKRLARAIAAGASQR
jgi:hypothetical protein